MSRMLKFHRFSLAFVLFIGLAVALSGGCAGLSMTGDSEGLLGGQPPVSTGLSDAVTEAPFLDDFNPDNLNSLAILPRGPHDGFLLRPGVFEHRAQSFCLHAGKYEPDGGDGYALAPLKGSRAEVIRNILQRSAAHPEIPQRDVQVLLWAILARTKISDMSRALQLTASQLLTPREIFEINGGALALIPDNVLRKMIARLPEPVQKVLEAEARLRNMFQKAKASYEELERAAVRFGDAARGEGSRDMPRGRWSYHLDGYFIRFFPSGYKKTLVQISVPENFKIERDELGRITLIRDGRNNRILIAYDEATPPLAVSGDPEVKACRFSSVRFARFEGVIEVKLELNAAWNNAGWTFVGVPSGAGRVSAAGAYPGDPQARYRLAAKYREELERLGKQGASRGSLRDAADLSHLSLALAALLEGTGKSKPAWADKHAAMVKSAWQYAVSVWLGGKTVAGLAESERNTRPPSLLAGRAPVPAGADAKAGSGGAVECMLSIIACPGDTARQRLIISTATTDPDAQRKKDCADMKKELDSEKVFRAAYENEHILNRAKEYHQNDPENYGWEQYDKAVKNFIKLVYDSGGPEKFNMDFLTFEQLDSLFDFKPPEPGKTDVITVMAFDSNSGEIVYLQPRPEGSPAGTRVSAEHEGSRPENHTWEEEPDGTLYHILEKADGTRIPEEMNWAKQDFIQKNGYGEKMGSAYFDALLHHEECHREWKNKENPDEIQKLHDEEIDTYTTSINDKQRFLDENCQ